MSKKEIYRSYCGANKELPIFLQDWWLDIVCGEDNWDVSLSFHKDGSIRGVWPYYIQKLMGFRISKHPELTPFLGVYIDYPKDMSRQSRRSSFERKTMYELVKHMPSFLYFRQNFFPEFNNWLPLFWRKYHQTSYYTYLLSLKASEETLYQNIDYKRKRQIKKALQFYQVISSDDYQAIYKINKASYERKGMAMPYQFETLKQLDEILFKKKARKIYLCIDEQKRVVAGAYIVKDYQKAYYLLGGVDLSQKVHYPMSLVFWHIIKEMRKEVDIFDFEGSVARKIERVFRDYGGQRSPFYVITKTRSRLADMAYLIFKGRRLS
ncbi:MAG: GNAT family N-acetyltransferase [Bacteroidota bacterium]